MAVAPGDRLPDASFKMWTGSGFDEKTTSEVFDGRKVLLFAVPGAFTPSCNDQHLPGYVRHADEIKSKGIDEIVCVAVNDPFVLDAWSKSSGVGDNVLVLSDGNATFTREIGMDFDGSGFSLGTRSKRYAMVVDDRVIQKLEVESAPPEVEVSSAESMLKAL